MALTISDTSYAGTFASHFWLPATFGMDSVQKGILYVQDGIKKKHTIGRIDITNPLQARVETPTSSGTFTIDGRTLEPQDIMAYAEFNPRDFEAHWLAEQLSPTLLARQLPVTAENYMIQLMLNRCLEQIETGIWQGSVDYTAATGSSGNGQLKFFDGFVRKMVLDSDVLKVSTPYALTAGASSGSATNIADAFDGCITLLASNKKALLSKAYRYQRLKFLVSIKTEQIYHTFLTTSQTFKGVNTTEREINKYKGYEIVPIAGMPDNTVIFCEAIPDPTSNLYLGMNSTEDNNLQLMRLQNNSELFFLKGLMKYDVEYGFSDQIALFTTLTSSDFTA